MGCVPFLTNRRIGRCHSLPTLTAISRKKETLRDDGSGVWVVVAGRGPRGAGGYRAWVWFLVRGEGVGRSRACGGVGGGLQQAQEGAEEDPKPEEGIHPGRKWSRRRKVNLRFRWLVHF